MVKSRKPSQRDKSPYWLQFAELLLQGHNQADAYQLSRPHLKWDRQAIVTEACKLSKDVRVVEHIEAEQRKLVQRRRARESKLWTMLDRREKVKAVGEDENSNGLTVLAAVKMDAQLAGEWLERQEVSSTVNLQALLAELPQSGLPVAREVAPALPAAQPAALPDTGIATPALPSPSAKDWELIDE